MLVTVSSYGGFHKWMVPPKSSILVGFSIINEPDIGDPPFMETPIYNGLYSHELVRYITYKP